MRARAGRLVPGPAGIFRNDAAFFRRGRPGAAQTVLTGDERARYHERVAGMAPADLLAWLHRSQALTGGHRDQTVNSPAQERGQSRA